MGSAPRPTPGARSSDQQFLTYPDKMPDKAGDTIKLSKLRPTRAVQPTADHATAVGT